MTWIKLMVIGDRLGCHQRADRSFFWRNHQFPVCARCTGLFAGYFLALFFFPLGGLPVSFCLVCLGLMFLDWLVQYVGLLESNNMRRLLTGVLGGYGLLTLEIHAIRWLIAAIA